MTDRVFDIAIVGGGPGGYVAAIRAAQLGMDTVLIEREELGGVCLNWGCIPTKSLLQSADLYRAIKSAQDFGIAVTGAVPDFAKVVERSRQVASKLRQGVEYLIKKNKVTLVKGNAVLNSALSGDAGYSLVVSPNLGESASKTSIRANKVILATGARAKALPALEPDGRNVWGVKDALNPVELPDSLLIVGSGAIGSEFASFYHELGSKVTLVEAADRVLPNEDAQVSDYVEKSFSKQGISVHTQTTVSEVKSVKNGMHVTLSPIKEIDSAGNKQESQQVEVAKVLVAVGVTGNIEQLGLEALGIQTDKGFISVDPWGQTNRSGVFAIGDVAGPPCLAHKASHQGINVIDYIAGKDVHPLDLNQIPACTYAHPQVASIGITESQAREQYGDEAINVGSFPFSANGKSIAQGDTDGFIKNIFHKDTGELLGAHLVGHGVTELISSYGVAKRLQATEDEIIQTIFPHPTQAEAIHEAVLDTLDRSIHQ